MATPDCVPRLPQQAQAAEAHALSLLVLGRDLHTAFGLDVHCILWGHGRFHMISPSVVRPRPRPRNVFMPQHYECLAERSIVEFLNTAIDMHEILSLNVYCAISFRGRIYGYSSMGVRGYRVSVPLVFPKFPILSSSQLYFHTSLVFILTPFCPFYILIFSHLTHYCSDCCTSIRTSLSRKSSIATTSFRPLPPSDTASGSNLGRPRVSPSQVRRRKIP